MIGQTDSRVKPLSVGAKLEILRDVRAIVYADWRRAEGRDDLAEVARCRAEAKLIQSEIDALTDGRGW